MSSVVSVLALIVLVYALNATAAANQG